jgi:hypothetical protein
MIRAEDAFLEPFTEVTPTTIRAALQSFAEPYASDAASRPADHRSQRREDEATRRRVDVALLVQGSRSDILRAKTTAAPAMTMRPPRVAPSVVSTIREIAT